MSLLLPRCRDAAGRGECSPVAYIRDTAEKIDRATALLQYFFPAYKPLSMRSRPVPSCSQKKHVARFGETPTHQMTMERSSWTSRELIRVANTGIHQTSSLLPQGTIWFIVKPSWSLRAWDVAQYTFVLIGAGGKVSTFMIFSHSVFFNLNHDISLSDWALRRQGYSLLCLIEQLHLTLLVFQHLKMKVKYDIRTM